MYSDNLFIICQYVLKIAITRATQPKSGIDEQDGKLANTSHNK